MFRKVKIRIKLSIILLFFLVFFFIINVNTISSSIVNHYNNTFLGEKLFQKYRLTDFGHSTPKATEEEEPIFWDLENGSIITYNPVVLFVNYYYWDHLDFYNESE